MTHVLVECPEMLASARVGVLDPLKPLKKKSICDVRFVQTKDITNEDVQWCDILICVRGCEMPSMRLVQAAKKAGRYIVYFLDDDLLNVPTESGSSTYFSDPSFQTNLKQCLTLSDCLWVVNPLVGEKYSQFCPNWFCSSVALDIEKLKENHAVSDGIFRILYAGSVDHEYVIQKYLVPAIQNVNKTRKQQVEFVFVGANPKILDVDNVFHYQFFSDYEQYVSFVQKWNFSLGLAPVMDSEFHQCKYYNKFVEYTINGMAGIYSDLLPYRGIVQHGDTGYLCENSVQSWTDAIIYAIEHQAEIIKIQHRAVSFLKENLEAEKVAKGILSGIPQLETYHAPQNARFRIPNMKVLFYLERLRFLCRTEGIRTVYLVPQKAWKKLMKK